MPPAVLPSTVALAKSALSPRLKMPPPSFQAELSLIVELTTEMLPRVKMPPPCCAEWLSRTVDRTKSSVVFEPA